MLGWFLGAVALANLPDLDGDGYTASVDCNDNDPAVHPGAKEVVGDGRDQNCDGLETCYADADKDGARTDATVISSDLDCADPGEARSSADQDCDDSDAGTFPGATEIAGDGVDEDCDGDELCWLDADRDGSPDGAATVVSTDLDCKDPTESAKSGPADCDDGDPAVHPGATETVGDEIDEDCDGREKCYADADEDGARSATVVDSADRDCEDRREAPASAPLDCDDASAARSPTLPEIPGDGIDEDCNGKEKCYVDADKDGARTDATLASTDLDCLDPGEAASSAPSDCDDARSWIHPGATEIVGDGIDEDCDGGEVCYGDLDGDGARSTTLAPSADSDCDDAYEALSSDPLDCLDSNPSVHPGAIEVVADDLDEDCDGRELCYADADDDGSRTAGVITSADADCGDAREGRTADPLDCDDADPSAHPGAIELVGDEIDEDCDSRELCWLDDDGDGSRSGDLTAMSADTDCDDAREAAVQEPVDCDDVDATVHPGATEAVGDGVDQDCDGREICYQDADGDHARGTSTTTSTALDCSGPGEAPAREPLDCDDGDDAVHPDAPEVCDGLDDDCDGAVDFPGCDPDDLDDDGIENDDDEALCASRGLDPSLCPTNPDLDDDGVIDGIEVGADLAHPKDTDGDALPDFDDPDDDGDGVATRRENGIACAGSLEPTYDADRGYWLFACDGTVYDFGGDALPDYPDLDGDGTPDFLDPDDDGDGVDTQTESQGDVDCDGIENYLDPDDDDGPCAPSATTPSDTAATAAPPADTGVLPSTTQPDPETDAPAPTEPAGSTAAAPDESEDGGCGCAAGPGRSPLGLLVIPLLLRRRRIG